MHAKWLHIFQFCPFGLLCNFILPLWKLNAAFVLPFSKVVEPACACVVVKDTSKIVLCRTRKWLHPRMNSESTFGRKSCPKLFPCVIYHVWRGTEKKKNDDSLKGFIIWTCVFSVSLYFFSEKDSGMQFVNQRQHLSPNESLRCFHS